MLHIPGCRSLLAMPAQASYQVHKRGHSAASGGNQQIVTLDCEETVQQVKGKVLHGHIDDSRLWVPWHHHVLHLVCNSNRAAHVQRGQFVSAED